MKFFSRRNLFGMSTLAALGVVSKSNADEAEFDDEMVADHVLVNVSSFERSLAWYRDKLGFEEEVRWTVDGLDKTDLAYLKRGSFRIEVASAPKTGGHTPTSSRHNAAVLRHRSCRRLGRTSPNQIGP